MSPNDTRPVNITVAEAKLLARIRQLQNENKLDLVVLDIQNFLLWPLAKPEHLAGKEGYRKQLIDNIG